MIASDAKKRLLTVFFAGVMMLLSNGTAFADVPAPVDAPAISAEAGKKMLEEHKLCEVSPADGKDMVVVEYFTINLDGHGLSAGNVAKVNDINGLNYQFAYKKFGQYIDDAKKALADADGAFKPLFPYTLRMEPSVIKADESGLSVLAYYDIFLGGAHNNYWYAGMNFDAQGNPLKITDICTDIHKLCEVLKKEIKKSGFSKHCFDVEKSFVKYDNENGKSLVFVRNNEAVYFYFSPYTIAPYASGYHVVKLDYAKHKKLLKRI